jgi:dTDP-4-amino-4,6-dideoxygalactose transaminase
MRIPLSYNPINTRALSSILERYEGKHHNQLIQDFEDQLAATVGSKYAVAVNSGTAAIHLALIVLGVKRNDLVIAPSFTYVATINPILYLGADPVLIDSEHETWNLDPELLENSLKELSERGKLPKAIVLVHTYGTPARINEIMALAGKYNVPVIEDAAESLGATIDGKSVGTLGDIGVYSFNNNKSVTGFGGGALVTNNAGFAKKAKFVATQAREDYPYYQHHEIGYNYGMNPIAAAYVLMQLLDLKKLTANRRSIFERYKLLLPETFKSQLERIGVSSSRWLSTFLLPEEGDAVSLVLSLREKGIETRPVWKPMHQQPLMTNFASFRNGNCDNFFKRGICLPSGNDLNEATLSEVASVVNSLLRSGY